MKLRISAKHIPLMATAFLCAVLYAGASYRYENFASADVFLNFFTDNSFLGIAAVGLTFVILSGGIDLSVGAVLALSAVMTAILIEGKPTDAADAAAAFKLHPGFAVPLVLAGGMLFGAFMGVLITFFRLPPFLVTLGGMFLARGIALVTSEESLSFSHPLHIRLSEMGIPIIHQEGDDWLLLRLVAVIYLVVVLIGIYIAHYTNFGRTVYALGGSESAAGLMGLNVTRTKIGVYAFSGLCSALAGVVYTLYNLSGNSSAGMGLELDAIAAVVIGGTLLSGGVGYVAGTFLGVLIFGMIQTIINFSNLDTAITKVAIAVLLLCFILLQKLITRTTATRKI